MYHRVYVRPTSESQVRAWAARRLPPVERVRTDVWAIPVPVHDNPIRYTYAYLLMGQRDHLLVDPGPGSPEASAALARAFTAVGVRLEQLTGIVVTHFHFDHWEGADHLARKTGAWVALGAQEADWVQDLTDQTVRFEAAVARFVAWGVPLRDAEILAGTEDYGHARQYRQPDITLAHGQRLPLAGEDLRVIHTPGHTPGHVCLHDQRRSLLFSGDHLLPSISSHVALNPFGPPDPLGLYLDSLTALLRFEHAEVLPAHQYRFTGIRERVDELRHDVATRLSEVQQLLDDSPGATVWDLARTLTWSRMWEEFNPLSQRMAVGETAAFVVRKHSSSISSAASPDDANT